MRIKIPTTEYISIHLMLLFIDVNEILFGPYVLFQYISCYCLSMIGLAKGDDHPVFQYISCYCLSVFLISLQKAVIHFNTSHVTVYHTPIIVLGSSTFISIHLMLLFIFQIVVAQHREAYFNTSHVTVYQILVMHHAFSFLISIHLMLLFIRMAAVGGERSIVFQYISCYCLSTETGKAPQKGEISIHLMLLFI